MVLECMFVTKVGLFILFMLFFNASGIMIFYRYCSEAIWVSYMITPHTLWEINCFKNKIWELKKHQHGNHKLLGIVIFPLYRT